MDELSDKIKEVKQKAARTAASGDRSGFDNAKLPPQAVELEEAVLGAMMLERDAVTEAIDILKQESFYKEAHQKIFGAIKDIFERSEPVDILTVTDQLKKVGELEVVGGPYFISQLTDRVGSGANVEYHARIVAQKHIQRELIRISSETIKTAYEDATDVFDLLDRAESDLFAVAQGNIRKNFDKVDNLVVEAIEEIEKAKDHEEGISGVESGFKALDRLTSGWQRSDLVILAARPGMGKTAFVLSMARNTAVRFKKPVGVFSLEMSSLQLVNRLIASETGLSSEKLKKGELADHEWHQLNEKVKGLSEAPLYIDDTPALSVFELRAKCRRLVQQHDVQLIIIDYLQLMTAGADKGNREQEISTISRSIKSIAKELNVPIIALSQLSRAVETRGGDKRPQLSDLRESGAIEQDADIVSFIYRPEYYGLTEDEEGRPTQNMAEIIIAKHRNGPLDSVPLKFIANMAKFEDMDETFEGFGDLDPNTDFDDSPQTITRSSKMNENDPGDNSGNESPGGFRPGDGGGGEPPF